MLYAPHLLTGAVVMMYSTNPVAGLVLAFVSHFVLDLMPHNDFDIQPGITLKGFMNMNRRKRNFILIALGADALLALALFIFIFIKFKNIWLNAGGLMGILPDLSEQSLMLFGISLPGWQDKLQFRVSAKYGFIYYPVIIIAGFYLLFK